MSSSENKDFRQLDNCFNIIFDPSSSEDKIMNVRSRLGIILYFCCIKDPIRTLNSIIQKMDLIQSTPRISIILFSCACYAIQFIPILNSSRNTSNFSWIEAPLLRHAVFQDTNSMYNLGCFFQAGGAKLLPSPDVFLCELLLRYESVGISITAKPIALLIDLNPEKNSSILWRLFKLESNDANDIFQENDSFLILVSKITSYGKLLPPKDENQLNILIKICENKCKVNYNNEGSQQDTNLIENESNSKILQNEQQPEKQLNFYQVEISLTILRWLVSHQIYCPIHLLADYISPSLDCLVYECWAEYAKYGDLSKLPKFNRSEPSFQNIYIKIIKNSLTNPNFSFESITINHWLWDAILEEFSKCDQKAKSNLNDDKKKHSLYELSSNELINCADIASILPEWFFIHCLRFKCRTSEISARLLKIISELPTSILALNFDDFIDFIMYHITSFPQNAHLIANCIRDMISFLLPRMNPLIERLVLTIDFFDESSITPRLIILNNIFCFGVEAESFIDIFYSLLESLPFLEGSISYSLCSSLLTFFSLATFYSPQNSEMIFNIAMGVICATYSSCAIATSTTCVSLSTTASTASQSSSVAANPSNIGVSSSSNNINGGLNSQLKRTMSAQSMRINSSNSTTISPLFYSPDTSHQNISSIVGNKSNGIAASSSANESRFPQLMSNPTDSILTPAEASINSAQIVDFSVIEEPYFVRNCDQSHAIYISCLRFFSVISADIVTNPKYSPADSFPLIPLAFQLIKKLPTNVIARNSEGLSMLIDFLPSFLPLFPADSVSLTNFLIEHDLIGPGKNLSLISSQLKQEMMHNNSFNLILNVIKFVSLTKQESFEMKPVNVMSLPDEMDLARQALRANPEIIPLVIVKANQLSLLLELEAPNVDNSIFDALSAKLSEQGLSHHEMRQIRYFLGHFNFKQPEGFPFDSWIRRDFSSEESEENEKLNGEDSSSISLSRLFEEMSKQSASKDGSIQKADNDSKEVNNEDNKNKDDSKEGKNNENSNSDNQNKEDRNNESNNNDNKNEDENKEVKNNEINNEDNQNKDDKNNKDNHNKESNYEDDDNNNNCVMINNDIAVTCDGKKNANSNENSDASKDANANNDDDHRNRILSVFERFYPVDLKLEGDELLISILKNFKRVPMLSGILCDLVSSRATECARLGKDRFWLLKFLYVHKVKYKFPQDTCNEKCIEFGIRNGFLPRNSIVNFIKPEKSGNKDDNDESNSNYNSYSAANDEENENEPADEEGDIEEWMKLDRLYILLPSEIEKIWPNYLTKKGRILASLFLPKQAIVPKDFLVKLIGLSSSLPSKIASLSVTSSPQSSSSSSSIFYTTIPPCVCQHILEYLLVFASNLPEEANQFFYYNENAIIAFMKRIDIHNPIVFESLFTFVNSLILMYGGKKKNVFVIKLAKTFLKIVFSYETGNYSACLYEVLPMLKKIIEVLKSHGKQFNSADSVVQFLTCLKKGIPSAREYIPDNLFE